jgi:hypothetical protein
MLARKGDLDEGEPTATVQLQGKAKQGLNLAVAGREEILGLFAGRRNKRLTRLARILKQAPICPITANWPRSSRMRAFSAIE